MALRVLVVKLRSAAGDRSAGALLLPRADGVGRWGFLRRTRPVAYCRGMREASGSIPRMARCASVGPTDALRRRGAARAPSF
jgi:hypothetical protein